MTTGSPRIALPLAGTVLFLACATASAHADIARLRHGATLEVVRFDLKEGWVVLHLPGGGQVALPQDQVIEIRRAPVAEAAPEPPEVSTPQADAVSDGEEETPPEPSVIAADDRPALVDLATRVARAHEVDVDLVLAVIQAESGYNTRAVSPKGAAGLMQLMPRTARRFEVLDPLDPEENVTGGVRYLKELLNRYSGEVRLALAAYNAGEEAVERFGGIPPYRETIRYVERIVSQIQP